MLFWGMLVQGVAIIGLVVGTTFTEFALLGVVLGIGTAVVYPTFLAAISDFTHPQQRAQSIGVFRLWRGPWGMPIGALISGLVADSFGIYPAILLIGALTILSALIIAIRME